MKTREIAGAPFWVLAHILGLFAVAVGALAVGISVAAAAIDGQD